MYKSLFVLLAVISLVLASGCVQEGGKEVIPSADGHTGPLKGVSVSPRSFEGSDFTDFLENVKQTQDVLLWAGDWNELQEKKAPYTFSELASQYDYIPVIEVGPYIQDSGDLFRPLNETNRQIYLDSTIAFVKEYKPKYFGMGVETDIFAEKNPGAFEEFVPFYNEVYDAIKEVSPNTKVFTVFQLENMEGLSMWGMGENEPHWGLMDRFKTDIAAFTTYPGIFYRDPSDIPEDHYTQIMSHTSKPIAFTEIGWHSAASPEGWESSDAEQAQFIRVFLNRTKGMDVEMMVWTFMYDSADTFEPFNTMGLIDSGGMKKPAWDEWVSGYHTLTIL